MSGVHELESVRVQTFRWFCVPDALLHTYKNFLQRKKNGKKLTIRETETHFIQEYYIKGINLNKPNHILLVGVVAFFVLILSLYYSIVTVDTVFK